ncbi:hypothetical protein D3C71_1973980 [compost metagenome]
MSATAILMASAPPGPSASADRPDMSVMKPIRITLSSAMAAPPTASKADATAAFKIFFMICLPPGV